VASINDNEELEYTDNAFDSIGFWNEEKWDCYKLTAAVMTMGEIKFKQKGRDDQAEPNEMAFPNKVAELMGVNADETMKSCCKPKMKVGTEWVTKDQTCILKKSLLYFLIEFHSQFYCNQNILWLREISVFKDNSRQQNHVDYDGTICTFHTILAFI